MQEQSSHTNIGAPQPVYFVSDIHLSDRPQPQNALFLAFLTGPAQSAAALYVLGDLFEYWLGDDVMPQIADTVAQAFRSLTDKGIPVYFMAGNRDFLLGKTYAKRAGFTLLPDSTTLSLCNHSILIHHGDLYCTQDTQYLKYRAWVHKPWIQRLFLGLPKALRRYLANRLRTSSKTHTQQASSRIFTISPEVIIQAATTAHATSVLHGHIHRAMDCTYTAPSLLNAPIRHLVLDEWRTQGSVIACTPTECSLYTFSEDGRLSKA